LADYAEDRRKNVQEKIKKKQERLQPQKKISVQEKEKVIKKFDAFLFELKQKSRRQRNEA
jgi:hypothetical protein